MKRISLKEQEERERFAELVESTVKMEARLRGQPYEPEPFMIASREKIIQEGVELRRKYSRRKKS